MGIVTITPLPYTPLSIRKHNRHANELADKLADPKHQVSKLVSISIPEKLNQLLQNAPANLPHTHIARAWA
jgi:hypothetical protein